jgi:hypothetical protein
MTKQRKPPAIKTAKPTEQPKKTRKVRAVKVPPGADPLVRMLPCQLTLAEVDAYAIEAARLGVEIDATVKRLADQNLAAQHAIKDMRKQISKLQHQAVEGVALREVRCRELPIPSESKVVLLRSDTGEYVEDLRPITAADLNGNLFGDK